MLIQVHRCIADVPFRLSNLHITSARVCLSSPLFSTPLVSTPMQRHACCAVSPAMERKEDPDHPPLSNCFWHSYEYQRYVTQHQVRVPPMHSHDNQSQVVPRQYQGRYHELEHARFAEPRPLAETFGRSHQYRPRTRVGRPSQQRRPICDQVLHMMASFRSQPAGRSRRVIPSLQPLWHKAKSDQVQSIILYTLLAHVETRVEDSESKDYIAG